MMSALAALAVVASLALIVGGVAWAIAAMRSPKRLEGRPKHGTSSSIGDAFLEVQALFEPAKRHVLEERRAEDRDLNESGDPPKDRKEPEDSR